MAIKIAGIYLLLSIFTFSVNAQFSQGAKDSAIHEIQEFTSDWNRAIIQRDSLALDRLLAPDYTLNGVVFRSNWMNNTLHHIVTDSLEVRGAQLVTFYGQAAKSEALFFWKATLDGQPRINGEYRVTDIWIRVNGRWQVLMRMSLASKGK